jgi:hypothetical protein
MQIHPIDETLGVASEIREWLVKPEAATAPAA